MSIRVTGVNELRVALGRKANLGDVKRVVRKNGADLQSKAQRKAPVESGTLKSSIGLEISNQGLTATAEPTAEYAPYQEHGTRYMEAQPYMGPAFNEQKEIFKRDIERLMD